MEVSFRGFFFNARVVKLADTLGLKSNDFSKPTGSSPVSCIFAYSNSPLSSKNDFLQSASNKIQAEQYLNTHIAKVSKLLKD